MDERTRQQKRRHAVSAARMDPSSPTAESARHSPASDDVRRMLQEEVAEMWAEQSRLSLATLQRRITRIFRMAMRSDGRSISPGEGPSLAGLGA